MYYLRLIMRNLKMRFHQDWYILLSCNICICQINVWFNNYWCLLFWYDYVLFLNSLHSLIQQSISSWHIKWWMRWFTRRYGDVSTINFVDISRRFSMESIKRCEMGDKWNNEIHNLLFCIGWKVKWACLLWFISL